MYPHERSLVKRMQNQPFALIGINSDPRDRVKAALERENITWRSFWDGGSTGGPIARAWGVHSWPTTYVLDDRGVIRYKDVRGEAMDKAVDELVERAIVTLVENLKSDDAEVRGLAAFRMGEYQAPEAAAKIRPLLEDADSTVRRRTAVGLLLAGQRADRLSPLAREAVADKLPEVRVAALQALGEAGDAQAESLAIAGLKDEAPEMRRMAADVLGEQHSAESARALAKAADDPDRETARRAILSLGRVGAAESVALLKELAAREEHPGRVWIAAALHAADPAGTTARFQKLLGDKDAKIRQQAVEALRQLAEFDATDLYIAALEDDARDVRKVAATALGESKEPRAAAALKQYVVRQVDELIPLLSDRDYRKRSEALAALRDLGPSAAPLLLDRVEEVPAAAQYSLASAIAALRNPAVVGPALEKLKNPELEDRVRSAYETIVRYMPDGAREGAAQLAAASQPVVRESGVRLLLAYQDAETKKLLKAALKDESPRVRVYAAAGLARNRDDDALGVLKECLKENDARVRSVAASVVATYDAKTAVPLLAQLAEDKDSSVQQTASFALARFKDKEATQALAKIAKTAAAAAGPSGFSGALYGVIYALQQQGTDDAARVLGDLLKTENANVQRNVRSALQRMRAPEAKKILAAHPEKKKPAEKEARPQPPRRSTTPQAIRRPPRAARIFAPVLLQLALTGFPVGIPPAEEDPLLARIAPETCLFYTSWAGAATPDPNSKNQTEQLLAEPDVQELARGLEKLLTDSWTRMADQARGASERAAMRAVPQLVTTLLTRPAALYVAELEIPPGLLGAPDVRGVGRGVASAEVEVRSRQPQIKAGLAVNLGGRAAEIRSLLEKLQSQGAAERVSTVRIGDAEFYRIRPKRDEPLVTWGIRGEHLLAGVGQGALEEMLQRAETPPPAWLTALRKRGAVERASSVTHADLGALIAKLSVLGGEKTPQILKTFGLSNLGAYQCVTGLDETGYVSRTWLDLDGPPEGILAALISEPLAAQDLALIPRDSLVALAFRLDAGRLLDAFLEGVERIEPRAAARMKRALDVSQQRCGFRTREDLLNSLGDVWTVWAAPGEGGLLTGWTAAVRVRDPQRLQRVSDQLVAFFRSLAGDKPQAPQVRQLEVAGHTISYALVPDDDFPFCPAWCVTDDQLVVSLFPQALKSRLRRPKDAESLAQAPPIAQLLAQDRPPFSIAYCDAREVFRTVYPALRIGLEIACHKARREGLDLDAALLPPLGAVDKHLTPFTTATRRTESGVESISRQTLPAGEIGASAPVAAALLLPAVQSARRAAWRTQSTNNLRQIAVAVHNYHDVYRAFPAAYSVDKSGKPLLSWRVHILPFIEQEALWRQFHFDEPWDSPHNKTLIDRIPRIYVSPGARAGPGKTNYLGNAGEHGVFVKPQGATRDGRAPLGVSFAKIMDGTANTVLAVEVSDAKAVIWTKPDDFQPDPSDPLKGVLGLWPGGFNAAFCDGTVHFLSDNMDRSVFRAMLTRDGGEAFQWP